MADDVTGITKNPAIALAPLPDPGALGRIHPGSPDGLSFTVGDLPQELLYLSAQELGTATKTSNATVIRTLQALGYAGLAELKDQVAAPFTTTHRQERLRNRIEATGGDPKHVWDRVIAEAIERIQYLDEHLSMDHRGHPADG